MAPIRDQQANGGACPTRRLRVSRGLRLCGIVTTDLWFSTQDAAGMDCADLEVLAGAGLALPLLAEAVSNATPMPNASDIDCLAELRQLDYETVNRLREAANLPPIERVSPPPAKVLPCVLKPAEKNCLGGVCIGDKRTTPGSPTAVTVGEKWSVIRTLEVCNGAVVQVDITRVFQDAGFDWSDVGPVQTGTLDEGSIFGRFLADSMLPMGFVLTGNQQQLDGEGVVGAIMEFKRLNLVCSGVPPAKVFQPDYRWLLTGSDPDRGGGIFVSLQARDQGYEEKCASRDASGLH